MMNRSQHGECVAITGCRFERFANNGQRIGIATCVEMNACLKSQCSCSARRLLRRLLRRRHGRIKLPEIQLGASTHQQYVDTCCLRQTIRAIAFKHDTPFALRHLRLSLINRNLFSCRPDFFCICQNPFSGGGFTFT